MSFDVVVAADLDWGIGKSNALPWPPLKGDMAHFRRVTSTCAEGARNAIVMGRKTWQSAEMQGKPLPRRLNVVVTRASDLVVPAGVIVAASLDAALRASEGPMIDSVFVIGGGELLREAFGHRELRWVYLTRVQGHFDCEAHIPDLDALGFTKVAWDGETTGEDSGVRYVIERLAPPPR